MKARTVTLLARVDLARPVTLRQDAGLVELLRDSTLQLHAAHYGAPEAGAALHVLCVDPEEWDAASHGPVRIVDLVRNRAGGARARTGAVAVVVTDEAAAALSPHRITTVHGAEEPVLVGLSA